jgi:spermidine synthase/tetratricopeptide (TPR) repeat protein
MTNQVMLAGYPLACRPDAKNVAVVGWGSGVTSGTALACPSVDKTVTIEIEAAVLDAAHKFDHVNLRPDISPKSVVEINDARNYLLATPEKFDVIISEPSNPWQAGVCNLFTKQYFKIAHDRLTDRGVFCTWLQFQEVAPIDVLHVLSAMQSQFKYVLPMLSNGCLMVLASDTPIDFSPAKADAVIASSPALKQQLANIGINSVVDVLSSIVCSSDIVPNMVAGVAPNTDDRNYLEFDVGKTYENRFFQRENEDMLNSHPGKPWTAVNWTGIDVGVQAKLMNDVAEAALRQGDVERARVWAQQSFMTQANAPSLVTAGLIAMMHNALRVADAAFKQAEQLDPTGVNMHLRRGMQLLRAGEVLAARVDFEAAAKVNQSDPETRYLLAKTYTEVGRDIVITAKPATTPDDPKKVLELLGDLPTRQDFTARHPDVLLMAAMANMRTSNQKLAETQVGQYIRMSPQTVIGWRTLGTLLFNRGERIGAAEAWRRGLAVGQVKSAQEVMQATKFAQQGKQGEAMTLLTHALEYDPANQGGLSLLRALAKVGNPRAINLLHELGN